MRSLVLLCPLLVLGACVLPQTNDGVKQTSLKIEHVPTGTPHGVVEEVLDLGEEVLVAVSYLGQYALENFTTLEPKVHTSRLLVESGSTNGFMLNPDQRHKISWRRGMEGTEAATVEFVTVGSGDGNATRLESAKLWIKSLASKVNDVPGLSNEVDLTITFTVRAAVNYPTPQMIELGSYVLGAKLDAAKLSEQPFTKTWTSSGLQANWIPHAYNFAAAQVPVQNYALVVSIQEQTKASDFLNKVHDALGDLREDDDD